MSSLKNQRYRTTKFYKTLNHIQFWLSNHVFCLLFVNIERIDPLFHSSRNDNLNIQSIFIWRIGSLVTWLSETLIGETRNIQKQPVRSVLRKRCSENMQQIYRRTLMWKCDFNKVASQSYWNRASAYVFSGKFSAYFQNTFL